jgi:serine protease Do
VTRGWLGVQIQPVTDDIAAAIGLKDPHGALVVEPQEGSPGAKAGIEAGDVVLSVNGERVADARDLSRRIAHIKPDTDTNLTIFRNGDTKDVTVKLGKLSENQQQADNSDSGSQNDNGGAATQLSALGLELQPASQVDGAGDQGVVITNVDSDSPAADRLSTGDVILEVGGAKVSSPREVSQALAKAKDHGNRSVLLRVRSGDNAHYVAVPVERG